MIISSDNNIPQLLIDAIKEISNDKNLSYETKLHSIRSVCIYYIKQIDKLEPEVTNK